MRILLTEWLANIMFMKCPSSVLEIYSNDPQLSPSDRIHCPANRLNAHLMTSSVRPQMTCDCCSAAADTCCLPFSGLLSNDPVHPTGSSDQIYSDSAHTVLPAFQQQPKSSELLLNTSKLSYRAHDNQSTIASSIGTATVTALHPTIGSTIGSSPASLLRPEHSSLRSFRPTIASDVDYDITSGCPLTSSTSFASGAPSLSQPNVTVAPSSPKISKASLLRSPASQLLSSRSSDTSAAWLPLAISGPSTLRSLLHEFRYVSDRMRGKDQLNLILEEWKFAARVLDRICFLCFLGFIFGCTTLFLVSANIQDV
jgi:hypothetical protein